MAGYGMEQVEDYWGQLWTSTDELQELLEAVVVPETWFFRDREAFTALVHLVTNEWLPAHVTGALRVLSIPCSTGEEPYSIAMALLAAGLPRDRFQVEAVDVSRKALARARLAVYGKNSFRGPDADFREHYFHPAPSGYRLADSVREQVRFHYGNLVAADFHPSTECYDIIFCRNLLIYFDRSTQELVIHTLARLLAPAGVLFVGPAEMFLTVGNQFSPIEYPMAFACRKTGTKRCDLSEPQPHPLKKTLPPRPVRLAVIPAARSHAKTASVAASRLDPEPPAPPSTDLHTASRLADAGRLAEAADVCRAYLREQGPSAQAYYLLGLVHDAQGDQQHAAECYRKVLYLESHHMEALGHLALVMEKQGDVVGARRLQERARRAEERIRR
jgi:chemotaxis protein methyltransferase WspC